MVLVPVSCGACGLKFATPNLFGGTGTIVSIGNTITCPRCHADANILDGTYNLMGDTVRILANSKRSTDQLRAFANALEQAKQRNATPEEIKATIKEHAPELSSIADILPKNRNELYQFVMAICAIVGALALLFGRNQVVTEHEKAKILDSATQAISTTATGSASGTSLPKSPMNRAQRRAQKSPRARRK